ncbi:MAG: MopE-related protein [Candidatus Pacearchaeota archaeon]|nr:MopE-related protein [Candidatus Pacearchaeota archaeon]
MLKGIFRDKKAIAKSSFAVLGVLVLVFSIVMIASVVPGATITTDKEDYAPEETVLISGSGFLDSTPINIKVTRPDSTVHTCPDPLWCPNALPTTSTFSNYPYVLDGILGTYLIDASDGTNAVRGSFSDSTLTVQQPNGGESWSGTHDIQWHHNHGDSGPFEYKIYYQAGNCGGTISGWTLIATVDKNTKTMTYSWDTTTVPNGAYCIGVRKTSGDYYDDKSAGTFTVSNACTPDCAGKQCGDNGCGGSCGTCSSNHGTPSCNSGSCSIACNAGYGDCNGDATSDGCEINLLDSDNSHCGTCATVCTSGKTCVSGTCTTSCISTTEVCNGLDDDCDGQVDEGVKNTYYHDGDSDTYGDAGHSTQACSPLAGYVSSSSDCNDGNAAIHPGATEICTGGLDEDCDSLIDCADTNQCSGNPACAVCGNERLEGNEQCEKVSGNFPDCCNTDCSFKAAQVECRASVGACDVVESCTGTNATCPVNGFLQSGTSCNDNLFCNGAETCNGAGVCLPGTTVVCNDQNPCTTDSCSNGQSSCIYTLSDTTGPVVSNPFVIPNLTSAFANVGAHAEDACSNIASAKYYVDNACLSGREVLNADDGTFNEKIEDLIKYDADFRLYADGRHDIYINAWDSAGNPSNCVHVILDIDKVAPDNPRCSQGSSFGMELDGQCNTNELLVCGNNPLLTAYICDAQSKLRAAEFFIDNFEQPNWQGISMQATDGLFDEQCEDVQAQVGMSQLSEGTHYIKLHGKDTAENWGKLTGFNAVSFIKDTTAPKTEKTINFAGGAHVDCSIQSANGNTLTDGCYYVKQGTTIKLIANDFNPNKLEVNNGYNKLLGEYAGNVVINWKVWYSNENDCSTATNWVLQSSGSSGVNQDVDLTLNQDSCHLIEYWAVDGICGNAETHHFELDIVDTQKPVTTKVISGPKYSDTKTGKLYVDGVTTISLTCIDPQPHPVDNTKIYYRYRVDGAQFPTGFAPYTGPFSFSEESIHELEYYCVDALGNTESHSCVTGQGVNCETDYVDHTKPVTTKTYGTPYVSKDGKEWITSQTPITLTAVDPDTTGHGCNSGVKETKYRVSLVSDSCCEPIVGLTGGELVPSPCSGTGTWNTYSTPFTIPQESCHLIEYYSVDNVDKTEGVKSQYVYVDNSKPVTIKTIGSPQYAGTGFTWITKNTQITLDCDDVTPHPVDSVTLHAKYKVDNNPTWIDIPTTNGYVKFTFPKDSIHTVEWYCEDALGNTEVTKTETDNVDTAPPVIVKRVSDNTVKPGDTVKICADIIDEKQKHDPADPGVGVDPATTWAKLVLGTDPIWVKLTQTTGNEYCGDFVAPSITSRCHDYRCVWDVWVKAEDYLGNEKWEDGIEIIVDAADPEIRYVLNPVSGRYYRDGKLFSVYAPAIDFGGDKNIFNWDNCKASGVKECRFYAVDYPYESINQNEVKNYWDYLHALDDDVFSHGLIVPLGSTPYVNGVCKGTISLPLKSGITDKAFLAYEIEDNAGNIKKIDLAKNADDDYILMDIDNEGPMVSIRTDVGVGNALAVLTSEDNVRLQAEIIDYASGFDECWADLLKSDLTDTGIDLTGHGLDYNLCEINGILPNGLESGMYILKVNARDELFNIGSDIAIIEVDNMRPTMGVVDPLKDKSYGNLFPVTLHLEDSSGIADGTVKFRVSEMPIIGNLWCLGGCEDTGWITLTRDGEVYSTKIELDDYGISGDGRYVFNAVACDTLYVPDTTTELGFDINADRNSMHCRMISQHGAKEEPTEAKECSDLADNDGDGFIDSSDPGCLSSSDDDETDPVCGDGIKEGTEECDDHNLINGDGCSSLCKLQNIVFTTSGTGTAGWSSEQKYTGFYSVKMTTTTITDQGRATLPFSGHLNDISSFSYWSYVVDGGLYDQLAIWPSFYLDANDDGTYDYYIQCEPYYTYHPGGTIPLNTWEQYNVMNMKCESMEGPDCPHSAPTLADYISGAATSMTCPTPGVPFASREYGSLKIIKIDMRAGYGGPWAGFQGYIDSLDINGVTLLNEPPAP